MKRRKSAIYLQMTMAQSCNTPDAMETRKNPNFEKEGRESSAEIIMPQHGEMIAPEVPDGIVEKIAYEMYGFTVTKCEQLNGYEDRNYHILVSPTSSNPHVRSVRHEGYVLRVINSVDTRRPAILYAQLEFMRHVDRHGIPTQGAVPSIKGENVVFYDFPSSTGDGDVKTHAVCLRTFIAGTILYDVTLTHDLCYQVGVLVASLSKALEDFHHPFYDTFDHLWSLTNIPKMKEFVHVITDDKDRRLIDDAIEQFSSKVLPRRNEIRRGYVHGDLNGLNILVQPAKSSTSGSRGGSDVDYSEEEYVISAVLDFQEACYTHPLYDLSICIAYIMLQPVTFGSLEVGGHILAGYVSQLALPEVERRLVRLCVAGRLVQSLVMGLYNHSLDPGNEYLLLTQKRGWHVLHELWATSPEKLEELWEEIQRSYANRK